MARPRKCRKVRGLPTIKRFGPKPGSHQCENIMMSVEEYETIRLIDYKDYTQEECSKNMEIARTTVQQIYNDARRKISKAIIEGHNIIIEGGDYQISDNDDFLCKCDTCTKACPKLTCHERKETKC